MLLAIIFLAEAAEGAILSRWRWPGSGTTLWVSVGGVKAARCPGNERGRPESDPPTQNRAWKPQQLDGRYEWSESDLSTSARPGRV